MAGDYVCDGPISMPLYIPQLQVDADLNGVMWSQEMGMFFTPSAPLVQLRLPPPFEGLD